MRRPLEGPNFDTRYETQAPAHAGEIAPDVVGAGPRARCAPLPTASPLPQFVSYGSKAPWLGSSVLGQPQSNGCPYFGGAFATQPIVGMVSRATMPSAAIRDRKTFAPLLSFGFAGGFAHQPSPAFQQPGMFSKK